MRGLEGKVAFVTGAASGIGRATAIRLGEEGARVAAADLNAEGAAATAATIGAEAVGLGLDVTDYGSVRGAIEEAERRLGPIEVLVNCAGWDRVEPFVENSEETWDRVIDINLKGVIRCTRAVLDGMITRKSGAIVSLGSDAGRMGEYREGVYAACKAGVIALSKSVAREVGRYGIRLNVVCPGMTIPDSDEDI